MPSTALDTLLQAAALAPSGDNTQPWRFIADRDKDTLLLDVDPARDPSPMNAGQRMARISLGAALENILRTADRNAWPYEFGEARVNGLIQIQLKTKAAAGTIDPLLSSRVTNRRIYDRGDLSKDGLERLNQAISASSSSRTILITDRGLISSLVQMIGRADALILGTKRIRDAFLAKVRFDAAVTESVKEGLSLGSLEISGMDRMSLRLMRYLPPPDRLLRVLGARRIFTRVATALAASASGFCLITSEGNDEQADIQVGRAWQSIWLRLTQEQLAAQPMMSLLVLQNILDHQDQGILSERDSHNARSLLEEFHAYSRSLAPGRPAVLMRFGFAKPPTARVGRLDAEALTRVR